MDFAEILSLSAADLQKMAILLYILSRRSSYKAGSTHHSINFNPARWFANGKLLSMGGFSLSH
jgi:hypothetical protein